MYIYSPLPIEAYFLPGLDDMCEAGTIAKLERSQSIWNLFWLSKPALDLLPGCKGRWSDHYRSTMGDAAAVVSDVMLDEVLHRKLLMHPTRFVAWFETTDSAVYSAYDAMGELAWRSVVMDRARLAAQRIAGEDPAISKTASVMDLVLGNKKGLAE